MWKFTRYELRYWLRTPMVWIFMLIYALFAFGATASDNIIIGGNPANIFKNAPYQIVNYYAFLSIIFLVLTTAFMNATANRDFETGMYQFVFTTPIKKRDYFFGKFLGAYLTAIIPLFGIVLGTLLAPVLAVAFGWTPAERFGPVWWSAHVQGFLIFGIPNILISGALIFGLAILFRSTVVSFVGTVLMLVCYIISGKYLGDLQTEWLAALTDPFGMRPYGLVTKYYTIAEKNSLVPALAGDLLVNRLFWIGIALVILFAVYWRFSFNVKTSGSPWKRKAGKEVKKAQPQLSNRIFEADTAGKFTWKNWWALVRFETLSVVRNPVYITVMAIGFIILIVGFFTLTDSFGTNRYPTSSIVADSILDSYLIFFYGFIAFYTGVLIWKERDAKINEIQDATPVKSGMLFTSKLLAVWLSILIVMLGSIVLGMVTQLLYGYDRFEIDVYFEELLLLQMSRILFLCVLSLLFHYLINNRYMAWFAFIAFLIVNSFIWNVLEIDTNMLQFSARPDTVYSDMNGFGPYVLGQLWFSAYWALFCLLLGIAIGLFYVRGKEQHFKARLRLAAAEARAHKFFIGAALLAFTACAAFVYYNTQILNTYDSSQEQLDKLEAYERTYKKYEGINQPRYTAFDYAIDLNPEARSLKATLKAWVKNKSSEAISDLHFTMPELDKKMQLAIPGATIVTQDDRLQYRIYRLQKPMQPGDSLQITYTINKENPGFENEVSFTQLTQNGTFFNSDDLLPHFGYQSGYEIQDKNRRAKLKLPPRLRRPKLDDHNLSARGNTYISNDSDWVTVHTVISTSPDQIAVAPGSRLREWTQNGRRYFEYQLDHKALNFYSFVSARYQVARKKWNGIDLEVYYDAKHAYNVEKMLYAMQRSLEYYTTHFGPYYHKQCRIIEFPRYASFAQAFPGTMPYSESIGFITDLRHVEEKDIDMVFYVVAHEMGHQYWAHQLCGAEMQGSEMMSEGFAQYSALMVMEKEYGRDRMKKFLAYEMDDYLSGRSAETEAEQPLMKTESQQYIHYNKASVVLYYLKEMIGEKQTNGALKCLLDQFAYKNPPYATSNFAVREFRKATPDSLQYLITDLFERITIFDNRALLVSSRKVAGGYAVEVQVSCQKFHADATGTEKPVALRDYMDVGIFAAPGPGQKLGKPLLMKRVLVTEPKKTFQFTVKEAPYEAGIDPYNYLVDRVPDDNLKKFP